MSTRTWLNLAARMSIFSTVVVGCVVTLALLQAAHSLHQDTTSAARPGQTKRAATSHHLACRPAWESQCMCSNTVLLREASTNGAPVEVSHQRFAPWNTPISSSRVVLPVSTSWVFYQISWSHASSLHLIGPCCEAGTTAAIVEVGSLREGHLDGKECLPHILGPHQLAVLAACPKCGVCEWLEDAGSPLLVPPVEV